MHTKIRRMVILPKEKCLDISTKAILTYEFSAFNTPNQMLKYIFKKNILIYLFQDDKEVSAMFHRDTLLARV